MTYEEFVKMWKDARMDDHILSIEDPDLKQYIFSGEFMRDHVEPPNSGKGRSPDLPQSPGLPPIAEPNDG